MKKFRKTIAILFIVFVAALTLILLLKPQKSYSSSEKRSLSQFPRFSFSSAADGSFMSGIEDWAADQFPLRDFFMRARTTILNVAGQNESHGVYRMKDGSLAERFDGSDPEQYAETIEALQAFAARYPSIPKHFMLVPNAVSQNASLLPTAAITEDQNTYIDQFYQDLNAGKDAASAAFYRTPDVRESFAAAKKEGLRLYYRSDHHWTTSAARLGYQLLAGGDFMDLRGKDRALPLSTVCSTFTGSLAAESGYRVKEPDSIEVYTFPQDFYFTVYYIDETKRVATCYQVEKLSGDDPYQVFFGGNHPLIDVQTSAGTGRKLLVFKDSYANAFLSFLFEDFDEIQIVDPRYYYDDIDALAGAGGFTDILFLYNVNTFSEDTNLKVVLNNNQ